MLGFLFWMLTDYFMMYKMMNTKIHSHKREIIFARFTFNQKGKKKKKRNQLSQPDTQPCSDHVAEVKLCPTQDLSAWVCNYVCNCVCFTEHSCALDLSRKASLQPSSIMQAYYICALLSAAPHVCVCLSGSECVYVHVWQAKYVLVRTYLELWGQSVLISLLFSVLHTM